MMQLQHVLGNGNGGGVGNTTACSIGGWVVQYGVYGNNVVVVVVTAGDAVVVVAAAVVCGAAIAGGCC